MKKSIIEFYYEGELSHDSVIVYRGKQWVAIPSEVFLDGVNKKIKELEQMIKDEGQRREENCDALSRRIYTLDEQVKMILGEDDDEEQEE